MTLISDYLAQELAAVLRRHGLVIWDDAPGQYKELAAAASPEGATFVAFDGSWWQVRRDVEAFLGGTIRPTVVVYLPTESLAPADDPLLELRSSGWAWKLRLPTLLKAALKEHLAPARLDELASSVHTAREAEAAVASGGDHDLRLATVLGAGDPGSLALGVLSGRSYAPITDAGAWPAVCDMLSQYYGTTLAGQGEAVALTLLTHAFSVELNLADGCVPQATTADQRRHCRSLLEQLQLPTMFETFTHLARQLDQEARLQLPAWKPAFADIIGTPGLDDQIFREACGLLESEVTEARVIAEKRLAQPWSRAWAVDPNALQRRALWESLRATARLLEVVKELPVPPSDIQAWYADRGWQVDAAHRAFEGAVIELTTFGQLNEHHPRARSVYLDWLDTACHGGTQECAMGTDTSMLRQTDIHDTRVSSAKKPVAYIWIDAMRFEMGKELGARLTATGANVVIEAARATPPTITPVGMASLTVGKGDTFSVELRDTDLVPSIGGTPIQTVSHRRDRLRAVHSKVVDLTLDDAATESEQSLQRKLKGADLVLVRSTEIDAAGERGQLAGGWQVFTNTLSLISRVVLRLKQAGVRTVVITADHGFVAPPLALGPDRTMDAPSGGQGALHRRAWVGRGGVTPPGAIRLSMDSLGVPGGLDLVTPQTLAVFRGGGSKAFFHGGLSPQELVIPVVTCTFPEPDSPKGQPEIVVDIGMAGNRIVTGTFAATFTMHGDLFAEEVVVRLSAIRANTEEPVADVLAGEGLDLATRTATLRAATPALVAFRVTAALAKDEVITLAVDDARTGRRLAEHGITVGLAIAAEDDLS